MCLLPGSRAHTRSQKSRAPQKRRGNVEAARRGAATEWAVARERQQQNTTLPRVGRRLSGRKLLSSVFFPRGLAVRHAQTGPLVQFGKRAVLLPALFYRLRGPLSSRFFKRSGQRIGFAASQCVQSTQTSKAQPGFEDCCAKNKSGYLRIRATAVKERIEAVTNGQGRQGREDLQDQKSRAWRRVLTFCARCERSAAQRSRDQYARRWRRDPACLNSEHKRRCSQCHTIEARGAQAGEPPRLRACRRDGPWLRVQRRRVGERRDVGRRDDGQVALTNPAEIHQGPRRWCLPVSRRTRSEGRRSGKYPSRRRRRSGVNQLVPRLFILDAPLGEQDRGSDNQQIQRYASLFERQSEVAFSKAASS